MRRSAPCAAPCVSSSAFRADAHAGGCGAAEHHFLWDRAQSDQGITGAVCGTLLDTRYAVLCLLSLAACAVVLSGWMGSWLLGRSTQLLYAAPPVDCGGTATQTRAPNCQFHRRLRLFFPSLTCSLPTGIVLQAEDRIHRIGQAHNVRIIYLLADGTADDVVWEGIVKKHAVLGATIGGSGKMEVGATSHLPCAGGKQMGIEGFLEVTEAVLPAPYASSSASTYSQAGSGSSSAATVAQYAPSSGAGYGAMGNDESIYFSYPQQPLPQAQPPAQPQAQPLLQLQPRDYYEGQRPSTAPTPAPAAAPAPVATPAVGSSSSRSMSQGSIGQGYGQPVNQYAHQPAPSVRQEPAYPQQQGNAYSQGSAGQWTAGMGSAPVPSVAQGSAGYGSYAPSSSSSGYPAYPPAQYTANSSSGANGYGYSGMSTVQQPPPQAHPQAPPQQYQQYQHQQPVGAGKGFSQCNGSQWTSNVPVSAPVPRTLSQGNGYNSSSSSSGGYPPPIPTPAPAAVPVDGQLTAEQLARIEANRQQALAKRASKMAAAAGNSSVVMMTGTGQQVMLPPQAMQRAERFMGKPG